MVWKWYKNSSIQLITINNFLIYKRVEIIFQRFIGSPLFEDIRKRAVFVHVDLPGQEDDAEDMGDDAPFPTMQVSFNLKSIVWLKYLLLRPKYSTTNYAIIYKLIKIQWFNICRSFIQALGEDLITVLDQLRIKYCIGIGDGAGANIITRFGMMHVTRYEFDKTNETFLFLTHTMLKPIWI